MYRFTSLNAEPKQQVVMYLSDNTRIVFNFEYKPNQLGWFFGFEYGQYNYQNMRLTTNYNILSEYSSYLPFGLRCETPDNEEPYDLEDFQRGYATLYLLTKADVKLVKTKYYSHEDILNE